MFTCREFTLVNMETSEERHIYQMQYIAWPDHGVPDDSSDFLDFVIRVRQVCALEPFIFFAVYSKSQSKFLPIS